MASLLLVLAAFGACVAGAATQRGRLRVPEDFSPRIAAAGVKVYQRIPHVDAAVAATAAAADAAGAVAAEAEDAVEPGEYVQVIDLSAGARVELWYGAIMEPGPGAGVYGGSSPLFDRQYLRPLWQDMAGDPAGILCLSNGQFFQNTVNQALINPTELSFPLKADGLMVSEGYAMREYARHRMMLQIWPDRVRITPLNRAALYASDAPDILVGLAEYAPVRPAELLGRTFVGALDDDGDGRQELLFIYNGFPASQFQAVGALHAFGATDVMMLDGGGSTQLICKGEDYIAQARPLPQTIATVPAAPNTIPGSRTLLGSCCRVQRRP